MKESILDILKQVFNTIPSWAWSLASISFFLSNGLDFCKKIIYGMTLGSPGETEADVPDSSSFIEESTYQSNKTPEYYDPISKY